VIAKNRINCKMNCRQLCSGLIFKFIDILKWYPSLHAFAPSGGPHPSARGIGIVSTGKTIRNVLQHQVKLTDWRRGDWTPAFQPAVHGVSTRCLFNELATSSAVTVTCSLCTKTLCANHDDHLTNVTASDTVFQCDALVSSHHTEPESPRAVVEHLILLATKWYFTTLTMAGYIHNAA